MANFRGSASSYDIGEKPPTVIWTVVRGDTSGFKVYVVDDAGQPLIIPDWNINMKIKRPNNTADLGIITDDAMLIMDLYPAADADDLVGEFTVWLTSSESLFYKLETSLIFSYQMLQEYGQLLKVA
jgi:hypothetical protein